MTKSTKKSKAFIQYIFLLFLICLTVYLVSTTLDIKLIPEIAKIVNIKYIALGMLLILMYILFESYIINIIISSIHKNKIKFLGFKIATMGLYYNLVTPFASGSQPIQVYSLTQYNISLSKSVAIITNKTVLFQSIVTIYCGIFMVNNIDLLKGEMYSVMVLMATGMCINVLMLCSGIFIVLNPKHFKIILNTMVDVLSKIKILSKIKDKKDIMDTQIDEYSYSIKIFIKDRKSLYLSVILTFIQLTIYFSISYCVYKAFDLSELTYLQILTLQVFLYMTVSPVPTPGNVGANEIGFLTIFANVFPKDIIGYSTFLYSGYVYYFMVIICGLFTAITHYSIGKNKHIKY
ncbi:MAG: lysylphosphatidylglycerol synthase transmembrane domain-containing protein [Peptostreptococcaceae bacterium]